MNKFTAMSKVLSSEILKRDPYNNEWKFVFKGFVFAVISKNAGKYFPHYCGRKGTLKVCNSFMQAVAEILEYFIEIHNANMVAGGEEIYNNGVLVAYVGSNDQIYTRLKDSTQLLFVQGNVYNHLNKYYSDVYPADSERGYIADNIDSAYLQAWINAE